MSDDRAPPPAPDSIQKGLLQLLWTTRPWIRNTVLVVVGLIAFVVAFVPQGVREDAMRKVFDLGKDTPEGIAHPDLDGENSHTLKLKNGHLVRVIGRVATNNSNVADAILVRGIESDAWRYNESCYNAEYGQQNPPLPSGTIVVDFDVIDQLPQNATLSASEFPTQGMGDCVVGVLTGMTLNEAGRNGRGHVKYAFRFIPN